MTRRRGVQGSWDVLKWDLKPGPLLWQPPGVVMAGAARPPHPRSLTVFLPTARRSGSSLKAAASRSSVGPVCRPDLVRLDWVTRGSNKGALQRPPPLTGPQQLLQGGHPRPGRLPARSKACRRTEQFD
ncbi:hypothetical protein NDU88_009017 [Pleurodeles waltl]|uniref:Uncharacterized protein n=1 Tax=Pleurodeles waltl TaxID=8319 RepID=A0AAV7QSE1_PLEWA|nr:hypothetical protein NDU88_009017 [Pleurodeles waltl]